MKRARNAVVKVMVKLRGDIPAAIQEILRELALKGFLVTLKEVRRRHARNAVDAGARMNVPHWQH